MNTVKRKSNGGYIFIYKHIKIQIIWDNVNNKYIRIVCPHQMYVNVETYRFNSCRVKFCGRFEHFKQENLSFDSKTNSRMIFVSSSIEILI